MSAVKVYTYNNCSTCRKATQWLREREIDFEELPVRETPPTVAELRSVLEYQGGDLRRLFNSSGADYRELGLKDKLPLMSEQEAFALMRSRGNLVKRPFLVGDGFGLVGFREAEWAQALG